MEQKTLRTAYEKSLPVPKIIMEGRGLFVTECGGQPITLPHEVHPKLRLQRAMDALVKFHQNEVIHGRPAMRDILINESGSVTFVDFEEARISGCPNLMARDTLLLLLDSYRLNKVSQKTRVEMLNQWLEEAGKGSQRAINCAARTLAALRWLPKTVLVFKRNRLSRQILLLERVLQKGIR
ncbi:hypothetical protein [Vibrio mexicanus]|uniref:hypothetical protein n=1 Tax=Vibrio mexicanus TaxID=1004326 RepID=UPI00063C5F59|nr:hypothetical protein [Vibrio mexicanus]